MKIRKVSKKDFKKIAELMLREFGKPPWKEKASLKKVLKTLSFYNKIGKIFVLICEGEIIGATIFKIEQYWEGPVIIIEDLVIDTKYQSKNYTLKLIKWIEEYAKKKNLKAIYFATHKKSPSLNKYIKKGYKGDNNTIFMFKKLK